MLTILLAFSSPDLQTLAAKCDELQVSSCQELAIITGGQCASPAGIGGCLYDSRQQYIPTN